MNLTFARTYIDTNERPEVFERLKGNMYLYRYDIQQEESIKDEETKETVNRYSFVTVQLKGYPNSNEVIKYLIRLIVSLEDELKLINDYNESLLFNESAEDSEYVQYLTLRRELKTKVINDFNNNKY